MPSLMRSLAATAALALSLSLPAYAGSYNDGHAYHIFPTPAERAKTGRIPHVGATGEMEYFAGSVFSNVNVISVIWGPNVNPQFVSGMPGFFTAIVNSTFVDQLSIYDTNIEGVNGKQGTDQTIARGTYQTQIQITPHNKHTTLTDGQVRKELEYQIKQGVLPATNPNNLYMIYFPANITILLGSSRSCEAFGAYHEAVDSKPSASNIFYGVMPDCGYSFDEETIVSSHEFAEATTDNIPTPGSHPKYPQAWNTSDGYEIGDLCEGTQGTLTAGKSTYYVQEVYLNNIAGCGTGNFHSP